MSHALVVFAVQFAYILCLGFQTQNVIGKHYIAAIGNSLALGCMGLFLTGTVARQFVVESDWRVIGAFLVAGPCGIATAMWVHPRLRRV